MSEKVFIENFIKAASEASFKNIAAYIQTTSDQTNIIIHLYQKVANREEFSKGKIIEMLELSEITISVSNVSEISLINDQDKKQNTYFLETRYGKDLKKVSKLNEIIELKDRSLLLANKPVIKTTNEQEDDDKLNKQNMEFFKICKEFSRIIEGATQILEILKKLYNLGYPYEKNIKLLIKYGNIAFFVDGNIEPKEISLEEVKLNILNLMKDWEDEINHFYRKSTYLSYLHGRQISFEDIIVKILSKSMK